MKILNPSQNKDAAIVWLRQDLRLTDNPALYYAATQHPVIIPLYILDETTPWAPGQAQRWWLHYSLQSLQKQCEKLNLQLVLKRGNAERILLEFCQKNSIHAVYWNRCYEPAVIARDTKIKKELIAQHIDVDSYKANLLFEPWEIINTQGTYFKVFTPFWRKCRAHSLETKTLPLPKKIKQIVTLQSDVLEEWKLLPTKPNWAEGFSESWQPGAATASKRLKNFIAKQLRNYTKNRDYPDHDATSRLSPHLHFGELSPRQIWQTILFMAEQHPELTQAGEHFLRQLIWREFSYHLLYHFPDLPEKNFQKKFDTFPWQHNKAELACWQQGKTGYPIVDAGMRELWHSGYMHNRVRMVVASFLTKHLLIDWRTGADWFWDTLLDADLANNAMGWQWVAGSGVDAAPYFRIFNPVLQGKKFDPEGKYVRRWIPELAALPNAHIHEPWKPPLKILSDAGITLGKTYPLPVVQHERARERALTYYKGAGASAKATP